MHWNWRVTADKYGVSLGWWKCSKITVVMVVQLCDYTKYHWVVHLKLVNNVIDELSLNEGFKKIHIFWPGVTLAYLLGAMREGFNVTSKALKPGFNSTWTVIFQMFKLDLEKAEEPEIKLPTFVGSSKKQESSRKTSTSALLTMLKPLTVDHNKLENFSRDGNTRPPDLPPEKSVCRSGSNS